VKQAADVLVEKYERNLKSYFTFNRDYDKRKLGAIRTAAACALDLWVCERFGFPRDGEEPVQQAPVEAKIDVKTEDIDHTTTALMRYRETVAVPRHEPQEPKTSQLIVNVADLDVQRVIAHFLIQGNGMWWLSDDLWDRVTEREDRMKQER
jgi:hypothetical protein